MTERINDCEEWVFSDLDHTDRDHTIPIVTEATRELEEKLFGLPGNEAGVKERYCEEHEWQKQEEEWSDGYECVHCETIAIMDESTGSITPILTMPLPDDSA